MRKIRESQGITQDRLAKRADLHSSIIGRLERGAHEPRLSTVIAVARGLGVRRASCSTEAPKP